MSWLIDFKLIVYGYKIYWFHDWLKVDCLALYLWHNDWVIDWLMNELIIKIMYQWYNNKACILTQLKNLLIDIKSEWLLNKFIIKIMYQWYNNKACILTQMKNLLIDIKSEWLLNKLII